MALFGSKKKTDAPKKASTSAKATVDKKTVVESSAHYDLSGVIKRPRITEKASMKAEEGVYAFEVALRSTKQTIAQAVKELYKVTPVKVAVVRIPAKRVFVRGKWGVSKGGKKAYVFLKKGETIEFV